MSYVNLLSRIAELERKIYAMQEPATVHERDHTKGVRFKIGEDEDGKPVLSSWTQPPDWNTGVRSRALPKVGSQHLLHRSPGGDRVMAFTPLGHHDNSQNPADSADHTVLYEDGALHLSMKGDTMAIKAGHLEITGEKITHNGHLIDFNHKHTGVEPGGGISGKPV
jgi:phage baseplate assembly protein gpV